MPLVTLNSVRFAGMATCVPKRVVSNLTDCKPQIRPERERLVRNICLLYTSPSPRDRQKSRMPSSA